MSRDQRITPDPVDARPPRPERFVFAIWADRIPRIVRAAPVMRTRPASPLEVLSRAEPGNTNGAVVAGTRRAGASFVEHPVSLERAYAMQPPVITDDSSAAIIAKFLKARGVRRVFALCGGHIMPIWMRIDAEGIQIVDVRDERAAVYMAHAYGELTGTLGVALVTAGPGVTNACLLYTSPSPRD